MGGNNFMFTKKQKWILVMIISLVLIFVMRLNGIDFRRNIGEINGDKSGTIADKNDINVDDALKDISKDKINQIIQGMSLEEKIGQMIMVSFQSDQIDEFIGDKKIGGYILFSHNIQNYDQVRELTRKINEKSKQSLVAPSFIAIDQEGGIVSRLDSIFHPFPGNMALGAVRDIELAYKQGKITGKMLSYLGINLNLAPVVDVNTNPENPVIGTRSFGENPEKIAEMATAFVLGQRSTKTISCIKHFPGHGNTDKDSHFELPTIYSCEKTVRSVDMMPFERLIEEIQIEMIMTAHIKVPSLDKEYPATLSRKILTDELRGRMGFDGVIITDDIGSMKAITLLMGTEVAAVKSIKAGADIILLVTTAEKIESTIDNIVVAVNSGEISEVRIDESVRRILELKQRFDLSHEEAVKEEISHSSLYEITRVHSNRVSKRAITQISNERGQIPIDDVKTLLLFHTPIKYKDSLIRDSEGLVKHIGKNLSNFDVLFIEDEDDANMIIEKSLTYDTTILFSSKRSSRWSDLFELLSHFRNKNNFILVSIAEPYESVIIGGFPTQIAVYSNQITSISNSIRAIRGEIEMKSNHHQLHFE